jgi:RimJ/RimL family protein N-acetyltransferase
MTDESDTLLGPRIDAHPAPRPQRVTLKGRYVTVAPLAREHAASLYALAGGAAQAPLFTYLFNGPFADEATFTADVEAKTLPEDPLYFAVIDNNTGKAVGYQSLMRIDTTHRVIEVGDILYALPLQGTPGSTEAQFLFARYIFATLGYRRYEWKCDDRNLPSRRAAARLGFTFEGVFRQHMIVKARSRDTAWFSMLDHEWPARRSAFEAWLAPENFDAEGRQKRRLEDLRALASP